MQIDADQLFRSVESALYDLHAAAMPELKTLEIESLDRSDRIGVRGDFPSIRIEFRSSSPMQSPELAMVTTTLEYLYPTEDDQKRVIRFETVSEIFQTGCESWIRKQCAEKLTMDDLCNNGLSRIVARQIAAGYAAILGNIQPTRLNFNRQKT